MGANYAKNSKEEPTVTFANECASCPRVNACSESNRTKFNSDRLGFRYRSAASHLTTTVYVPAGVFWDATASHKSAEGRYIHYEWSRLTVVEKRGAVKR